MIAVINASPLIYLGKIGLLEFLPRLFSRIITSEFVKEEVLDSSAPEFAVLKEAFSTWLESTEIGDVTFTKKLVTLQIHEGEASIIAIAKHFQDIQKEPVLIIDDRAARDLARTLGFSVTGTLGILLRLYRKRKVTSKETKQYLRFLVEETDFRISVKIYSKLLAELEDTSYNQDDPSCQKKTSKL